MDDASGAKGLTPNAVATVRGAENAENQDKFRDGDFVAGFETRGVTDNTCHQTRMTISENGCQKIENKEVSVHLHQSMWLRINCPADGGSVSETQTDRDEEQYCEVNQLLSSEFPLSCISHGQALVKLFPKHRSNGAGPNQKLRQASCVHVD